jgi:hypothetical protein
VDCITISLAIGYQNKPKNQAARPDIEPRGGRAGYRSPGCFSTSSSIKIEEKLFVLDDEAPSTSGELGIVARDRRIDLRFDGLGNGSSTIGNPRAVSSGICRIR